MGAHLDAAFARLEEIWMPFKHPRKRAGEFQGKGLSSITEKSRIKGQMGFSTSLKPKPNPFAPKPHPPSSARELSSEEWDLTMKRRVAVKGGYRALTPEEHAKADELHDKLKRGHVKPPSYHASAYNGPGHDYLGQRKKVAEARDQIEEFALPYIGSPLHVHFDPSKHPRGRSARFIEVLGKLERAEHGSTVTLPHGIKVRRDLHGLQVEGGGHKPVELEHHHAVAAEALFRHTVASGQGHEQMLDELHHARRQAASTHGADAMHLAERTRQTRLDARKNRASYLSSLSPALFEKGKGGGRVYATDATHARVEGVLGTIQQRANQAVGRRNEWTGTPPSWEGSPKHKAAYEQGHGDGLAGTFKEPRYPESSSAKAYRAGHSVGQHKRLFGRKNEPALPPDRGYVGNDANDYLSRKDDEHEFGDPESDDPVEQWLTKERQMGRMNQPTLPPEHQAFVDATRRQLWDMDASDAQKLDDEDLGNALEILGPEEFKRWMVEKDPGTRVGIPWLANVSVK